MSASIAIVFIALFVTCLAALAFVPAFLLWRMTKDKRFPIMWVTCSALIVGSAAFFTLMQGGRVPPPKPINEPLTDVADRSGTLNVTAVRLPNPHLPLTQIALDVENTSDTEQYLGVQYTANGGAVGQVESGSNAGNTIVAVAPKWKGTVTCDVQLPPLGFGANIVIALARCNTATSTDPKWLPKDSEAIYQNRFELVPASQPPQ